MIKKYYVVYCFVGMRSFTLRKDVFSCKEINYDSLEECFDEIKNKILTYEINDVFADNIFIIS